MGDGDVGTVERAFQLARSGACASMDEIRARLTRERYSSVNEHLSGPTIRRELTALCKEARAARMAEHDEPGRPSDAMKPAG